MMNIENFACQLISVMLQKYSEFSVFSKFKMLENYSDIEFILCLNFRLVKNVFMPYELEVEIVNSVRFD